MPLPVVTAAELPEWLVCSGEELSRVVRLESHPFGPHDVAVPPSAVAAVSVPPSVEDDTGPGPAVPVRQTSGVTVMYEVTAEGQFVTVTVFP